MIDQPKRKFHSQYRIITVRNSHKDFHPADFVLPDWFDPSDIKLPDWFSEGGC